MATPPTYMVKKMKRLYEISAIILLIVITGCGRNKQSNENLIIVDVTRDYPEKELILQDFMDVEYIPLETNDEFVNQGIVMAVGKEMILVKNNMNDGDIFIYDRTGKALRKINRKGEGGEEYLFLNEIVLDEDRNEIFVNSAGAKKILVYDLHGTFKRSFRHPEDAKYYSLFDYDKDNLICYDTSGAQGVDQGERGSKSYHAIISKQDGSITHDIFISFKKNISQRVEDANGNVAVVSNGNCPIVPYYDDWILSESSSDTIYKYAQDGYLTPLIVRTPSVQSADQNVLFFARLITDRFYFLHITKLEYDFEKRRGFPFNELIYDREENAIFKFSLYNADYINKKRMGIGQAINAEIAFQQKLEAYQLVESYKKGELKDGKLKEIAETLDKENNPVIMLVKHRK